ALDHCFLEKFWEGPAARGVTTARRFDKVPKNVVYPGSCLECSRYSWALEELSEWAQFSE
ncbi:MAG: hypothetical protein MUO51_15550, partial [Woeseiaceae bacterium]|nr:hypothetical protein [Woeseiaceae bacterium]